MSLAGEFDRDDGVYDDEKAEAALDLLHLFTRAKRFVPIPVPACDGQTGCTADLDEMCLRLAEAIVDDCLLFDERTILTLFDFYSAWRSAAYEPSHAQGESVCALERCYRRAAQALVPRARHAVAARR